MVRSRGLEPPRLAAPVPQTGVSTNFTTTAKFLNQAYLSACETPGDASSLAVLNL